MSAGGWPTNCARASRTACFFADQWNNLDNRKAHYVSTGPEIWQETSGKIDGFICSIGTGGTIAGVSTFLREKKKDIVIGVADPKGAAMYNFFAHGEAKATRRRLGHAKASGSGASRRSSRTSRSITPISFPTRRRCR